MLNVDPEDYPTERELAEADAVPGPTDAQKAACPVSAADFEPTTGCNRYGCHINPSTDACNRCARPF